MQHFPLTEKLHTDVLEEKYGTIHAVVVKHDDSAREALLVDKKGVARTYAVTFFSPPWTDKAMKTLDAKIRAGEPIGKAFRSSGYIIRKNVLDVFVLPLPLWLRKEFKTTSRFGKARLSEFYAKKHGSRPVIYGLVTEVYTPDFRKPVVNEMDKVQIGAVTSCLLAEGFSMSEIYRRIGDENNYEDAAVRYEQAKKKSRAVITRLRKKIMREVERKG